MAKNSNRSGSRSSSAGSQTTTDHDQIREWAEARGGEPACVRGTGGGGDAGLLRIDFPGYSGEDSLEHISWDEFFEKFDEQKLALLYQETTADGQQSNFNKLVRRQSSSGRRSGGGKSANGRGSKSPERKSSAKKGAGSRGGSSASRAGSSRSSNSRSAGSSRGVSGAAGRTKAAAKGGRASSKSRRGGR